MSPRPCLSADFIGLRLMSKACFDPRESPKMWQRMSASETSNSSQFPGAANLDFLWVARSEWLA